MSEGTDDEASAPSAPGPLALMRLVGLALACVFGVYLGARDLIVALSETEPTTLSAARFASSYDGQRWIEVDGRLLADHARLRADQGPSGERTYVTLPLVGPDWTPAEPVHVLVTLGPYGADELAGWRDDAASLSAVRGLLRTGAYGAIEEQFAHVTLADPWVVINEGTAPQLVPSLLFGGAMLLVGGIAGFLLFGIWRERRRR